MLVAFLESFKYVGHMLPLVFLRVFMGYYYLNQALIKYSGEELYKPVIANQIADWLPKSQVPFGYKAFIEEYVITHWQTLAYSLTGLEFLIAFSYLVGFAVRPIGIIAAIMSFNLALLYGPSTEALFKTFFAVHLTMAWLGAGRCLGVDYYFYKRQRGIWW